MNIEHHTGVWRSYKTFFAQGAVKHHEVTSYSEIIITTDGDLVLRSFSAFSRCKVLSRKAWEIRADGKRHFLHLEGKKAFEIVTLEKTELVLQDMVTGEKIFFASLPLWQERLQCTKASDSDGYLTLWSKSLIKLIKLDE